MGAYLPGLVVTPYGRFKVLKCLGPLCTAYFDPTMPDRVGACRQYNVDLAERLYGRVRQLLDRPVPARVRARLESRWARLEHDRQAWWSLLDRVLAGDPAAARLYAELQAARRAISRSLCRDGVGRLTYNWVRTDYFVNAWARQGLSPDARVLNRMLMEGAPQRHPAGQTVPIYEVMLEEGDPSRSYVSGSLRQRALQDLDEWQAQPRHPLERAAGALQRLVSIHPFADANGRTARLVMDHILLAQGYPPALLGPGAADVAVFGGRWTCDNVRPEAALLAVTAGVEAALARLRSVRHDT